MADSPVPLSQFVSCGADNWTHFLYTWLPVFFIYSGVYTLRVPYTVQLYYVNLGTRVVYLLL